MARSIAPISEPSKGWATIIVGSASEQALESVSVGLLGRADVRLRAFADEGFGPRTVQALRGLPSVAAAAPVSERRLTVSTDPTVMLPAALQEAAKAAGVELTIEDGAIYLMR